MPRSAHTRFICIAVATCATLLITACQSETKVTEATVTERSHRNIETIADEILAAMLQRYPAMATRYSIEGARHDRLFDNSLHALSKWQAREDVWLAELDAIGEPIDVGSRDWVTFGILYEQLAASQATRICRKELWETSTTTAWYTGMPFVFDIQPLETDELKEQALARLGEVDRFIDNEVSNLKEGLEMGYSSPRLTVAAVPDEVRALRDDNSPFLAIGVRAENEVFDGEVRTIFNEEIVPAIDRFADFIEGEYLDRAREEIAISHNPNGAECYPALVRSFATVQPTADEIHALGLAQISKIRSEMQAILAEHYEGESVEEFVRRINVDTEFTFRTEDEVLQYSVDSLDAAKKKMADVFGLLPRADVVIKPYPAFAASGVGEYHSSSEDGTRPGIFYIAVRNPENRSLATQQSTLYHETYPGHHLQGAIALELGDKVHSLARYLWNSGFGEGWALYSERVAQELDLYNGPLDLMGLLSDQAARAARLVIDSGIHAKGWTRQQSVDYMMNNTGWAPVDIQNDINRYISWPGQANSYMLGMLEIRRLRSLAEVELGEKFDIRDFHDRILENGSMTLPMTEKAVLAWIEETKQE
jgi:uncharacterized protein (DUF885 family)